MGHYINDLTLIDGADWEKENFGWKQTKEGIAKSLIIKPQGSSGLFIFIMIIMTIVLAAIIIIIVLTYIDFTHCKPNNCSSAGNGLSFILLPLFFGAIAFPVFITGIKGAFGKLWIDVYQKQLIIYKGFFKRGKPFTIKRTPKTEVIKKSHSFTVNKEHYYYISIDDIKVAYGMTSQRADEYKKMIECLLDKNLEVKDTW